MQLAFLNKQGINDLNLNLYKVSENPRLIFTAELEVGCL